MTEILIIEDDQVLGGAVSQRLRLEGFVVTWVQSCAEAMRSIRAARPDFVLADIRLPDGSGEDLYRQALPFLAQTPIVFATAFADVSQAVRLVRAGADDYLIKPYDVDVLVMRLRESLAAETEQTTPTRTSTFVFGYSEATAPLARDMAKVAQRDLPVFLRGETGVGKEIAARAIHAASPRSAKPFVAVNCGAIARELMESQFFGHEKGAFTGATSNHIGYFEEAAEGTLFLDEVGELDGRLQIALLRVLQDGQFRRLGARQDHQFQGRIIAATNADLAARIAEGSFREDLYYRLAVVELTIPPLRQRPAEIQALAHHCLRDAAQRNGLGELQFTDTALAALQAHAWPGNARELRNRVERAVALSDTLLLDACDLFPEQRLTVSEANTLADVREQAELDEIERVLTLSGGKISEAAKRLGVSRTTLWKRRKKKSDSI